MSIFLAIIIGMYLRTQPDYYESALESAFFQSMTNVAWGIALAWIIFSCHQRQGTFIRRFLELAIFQIVSKLSYSMFLTHVMIQFILVASQRQPGLFQNNHLVILLIINNNLKYIYIFCRFTSFGVIWDSL